MATLFTYEKTLQTKLRAHRCACTRARAGGTIHPIHPIPPTGVCKVGHTPVYPCDSPLSYPQGMAYPVDNAYGLRGCGPDPDTT